MRARRLHWTVEQSEASLRAAGLTPVRAATPVRHPFMGVPGTVLRVPGADVQLYVYIYADALARARDTDRLDTARVAPRGVLVRWPAPPALVTDNNLAAIVLTRDAAARRRVRDALTIPSAAGRMEKP